MGVDGERRLDVRVSENLLSDLRMHAGLREQRRERVAQRMERERSGQRSQPERTTILGAPALRAVGRALYMAAAGPAAPMLVPFDDAGAAERPTQDSCKIQVEAPLFPVRLREEPLGA